MSDKFDAPLILKALDETAKAIREKIEQEFHGVQKDLDEKIQETEEGIQIPDQQSEFELQMKKLKEIEEILKKGKLP